MSSTMKFILGLCALGVIGIALAAFWLVYATNSAMNLGEKAIKQQQQLQSDYLKQQQQLQKQFMEKIPVR